MENKQSVTEVIVTRTPSNISVVMYSYKRKKCSKMIQWRDTGSEGWYRLSDKKSSFSHFIQKVIFPPALSFATSTKAKHYGCLKSSLKRIPTPPPTWCVASRQKWKVVRVLHRHSTMLKATKRPAGGRFPRLGEPSTGWGADGGGRSAEPWKPKGADIDHDPPRLKSRPAGF